MTSPLENPENWTKPKVWIVPLIVTAFVDDPEKYDSNMKDVIAKMVNELRAITKNLDSSGKQLQLSVGEALRNPTSKQLDDVLSIGLHAVTTTKEVHERFDKLEKLIDEIRRKV